MVIISKSRKTSLGGYGNTQYYYAITYIAITFVVLLILNIYCSNASQKLFYQSKEASMLEKCHLAADEISQLEVLNTSTITGVISQMDSITSSRLIVTDHTGLALYDSQEVAVGRYILFPEVLQAMTTAMNSMPSRSAAPTKQ